MLVVLFVQLLVLQFVDHKPGVNDGFSREIQVPVIVEGDKSFAVEDIVDRLSVLNRTRDSLLANESGISDGHVLNRALVKQINIRRIELDSLTPNGSLKNIRSSTPIEDGNCTPVTPINLTPTEPIPSSHRRSVIVCSIRKEPILSCSSPKKPYSSSIEPQVPWSPNSSTTGNANSPQEKLLDLITSSSTAHLLSPLFSSTVQDTSLPEDTDMENLVDVKDSCNKKIRQFDSFIRLHAIDKLEPNDIIMHYNGWMEELSKLTNDLVDSVENMLYKFFTSIDQAEQNTWKEVVKKREESYFTFRRALSKAYDTNSSSSAPTTPAVPAPGGGGGAHAQKARAAQVEIEIDSSIIET